MASDNSFDILAQIDVVETKNAVENSLKEITKRYDFKGSISEITFNQKDNKITIHTEDDYKLQAIKEILLTKLAARKVPPKAFTFEAPTSASNGTIRVEVNIQQGIPQDKAKEIVKMIKGLGFKKIQASIQQDVVRVSGKDKDELQSVMAKLKEHDFNIFIDFGNYR